MLGTEVDLGKVDTDAYVVAGIADHLCKWESCYRTTQLLGGDTRFVLSTSGHIASMVNPPGNEKASFQTAAENPPDPRGLAGVGHQGQGQLVGRLRRVAGRAHRRGAQQAATPGLERSRADLRRPGRPMSTTADPDPMTAEQDVTPAPDRIRTVAVRGIQVRVSVRPGSGASPTSRRCCCATGSAPASRRCSRWSTRSTPTAA